LNAQSSQKVIEELSDAFQSWFDLRHKFDEANPPGYRKNGDERPRSTVTFKADGFKHDPETTAFDSAKGRTSKEHFSDFILCGARLVPTLTSRKSIRCRTFEPSGMVMNGNYTSSAKINLKTNDSVGDGVAGIDLGIKNIATVAFPDSTSCTR